MKKIQPWHALVPLAVLTAGCATAPATSGRYMQITSPMTGVVVVQMTWPSEQGCSFVLRAMKAGNEQGKQAAEISSCKTEPAKSLPFRATLHDSTGDFNYDIEASGLIQCATMVRSMVTAPTSTSQIVSDCKAKT